MAPKTATPKSAAMVRVPLELEPVPEHVIEAITGEQLAIDVAALTGHTIQEVRLEGVQTTLVALYKSGGVREGRLNLQRLKPPVPSVSNEPNAALNAVPCESAWEARHLMNETMVQHRLSRKGPVSVEVSNAFTAMDCEVELTHVWNKLDLYITTALFKREWDENTAPMLSVLLPGTRRGGTTACRFYYSDQHWNGPLNELFMNMHSLGSQPEMNGPNNWMVESTWTGMTKAGRLQLECGMEMPGMGERECHRFLDECVRLAMLAVVTNGLYTTGMLDLSRFPCHQLNGSFNALSALRKTVQQANQGVSEENANDEAMAFIAFRGTKTVALRRWVAGGAGGHARMKLANYFNRQFAGHISTHELDRMVPMTGGLEHDCSTWDEIYENEDNEAANAWNAPSQAKGSNDRNVATALAQTANALEPGAEIVLRKNAKGTVK
ncbi:yqkD [Symbiodinium sp. CCMP2592]|nr:yqkD [Symbiodinium sp. CCMP2592]